MNLSRKHHEYWNRNLRVTAVLLLIWFALTFGVSYGARELNAYSFIGPLGFYMCAQGVLIAYVAIIWFYVTYMNRLDREYGVHESEYD